MTEPTYRKIKRDQPPEPDPGIDHPYPIGPARPGDPMPYKDPGAPQGPAPRKRTGVDVAKDAIVGWGRRGINNFLENASRPILDEPERRGRRGGRRKQRGGNEPMFNIPQDPGFNLDMMMDDGPDFSLHPDPMVRGLGQRKQRHNRPDGAKRVTVTTRTYHY